MNVAQYIAKYLAGKKARKVFMLTGGGAMFLNDALSFEPGLEPVFCHHEQACAMAAEGYARVAGVPGIVNVTIGGGIFRTPAGIATRVPDPVFMLGVWVLGGVIVL